MASVESQDDAIALLLWPWWPSEPPWSRDWWSDPEDALSQMFGELQTRALHYAIKHGLQFADAEDFVQDFLVHRIIWARKHANDPDVNELTNALRRARSSSDAHSAFEEFTKRASLFPNWLEPKRHFWLHLHRRLDDRRQMARISRDSPLTTAKSLMALPNSEPEAAAELNEATQILESAAAQLPPKLAALFALIKQQDLNRREQAAALRVSWSKLSSMREDLRLNLQKLLHGKIDLSQLAFFIPKVPRPRKIRQKAALASVDGRDGRAVQVWYGTNRVPINAADHSRGYTSKSEEDGTVHYGRCRVYIPDGHCWGELRTPLWKRLVFAWRPSANLELLSITNTSEQKFAEALHETLAMKVGRDRDLLLFIHGYNVTFEDAALRAAQLQVDLNAAGATAFFSWPSKGAVESYLADEETIRISEKPLLKFLKLLHEKVAVGRIHVLVHSMGNRALARLADLFRDIADPVLGEVVLAAPDINVQEFEDQAKGYKAVAARTTMYASSGDRALLASKTIHEAQRAGQLPPPIVVDGIHTIDVSGVDLSFMGHGYFGACAAVLHDMHELFVGGLPPGERARLKELTCDNGNKYWRIHK